MRLAAALANEIDAPARPPHALHGQRRGRHAADLPPRHCCGRLAQGIDIALPPFPQQQGHRAAFLRRQLQTPRGRHGNLADFAHDGAQPSMPQPLFHDGKHILIAPAFCLNKALWRQSDLSQTGGEQLPPAQRPQHGCSRIRRPCGNASCEQSGCGIVAEPWAASCNVMKRLPWEPSGCKTAVQWGNIEAKARFPLEACRSFDGTNFLTQCAKP